MPHTRPGGEADEPPNQAVAYGRGVRTALRDNASAYGFSLSVTAAYGLATAERGPADSARTVAFALGAALAFILVSVVFLKRVGSRRLPEGSQVTTLRGGFDFLSVAVTVATAYGLARIPGFWAWPLTGLGTVVVYLLVGGLDVVFARAMARRSEVGRSD